MIIYFTLPNFYFNLNINNFFYSLSKAKQEYFKLPIAFNCATGNFPYCYWNGGYNNNAILKQEIGYKHFAEISQASFLPLRFNCANVLLQKEDFYDNMGNLILQLNENGSNTIEISNLELYLYLKEKYPTYRFVFSPQAELLYDITPEFINLIAKEDDFKIISLFEDKTLDLEFLEQINHRKKIELTVNPICNLQCPRYFDCQYYSHKTQYDYSFKNEYKNCNKSLTYQYRTPLISLEDIQNTYIPLGITHFRLSETICDSKDNLIIFLINYFIKEEYHDAVYQLFLQENIK